MAEKSDIPVFQNNPVMVLVLGLICCPYLIYWNMKMAPVINKLAGKEVISPIIAILSGICFPASIYYYYLASSSLPELGRLIGKEEELKSKSTLLLILGIFVPGIAAFIFQGFVNELYGDVKPA